MSKALPDYNAIMFAAGGRAAAPSTALRGRTSPEVAPGEGVLRVGGDLKTGQLSGLLGCQGVSVGVKGAGLRKA